MAKHEAVRKALAGKHDGKGEKLHTHSVKYERADNGGLHAHVERHTAAGHHHTEHHVLNGPDEAAEHLQEHLGDQPEIGAGNPPEEAPPPPAPLAGGASSPGADGGGGGAPMGM